MHENAVALEALHVLFELACGVRPRDLALAQASFDAALRGLITSEDFEEREKTFREPESPAEGKIPF